MTLISAYDVVRHFPMKGTADPALFKDYLHVQEEKLARDLLGWDFYQKLKTEKADYSSVGQYLSATTYAIEDNCLLDNIVYEATAIATGQAPPNASYWKEAPSFSNALYETLWSTYLRPLIAWKVTQAALPTLHFQVGSTGIQKGVTNSSGPISRTELADLEGSVSNTSSNWEQVMDAWIKEQEDNAFSLYTGLTTHRKNQRRRRSNFGFNLNFTGS